MPPQPSNRPLGALLKALAVEKIDFILIGMMAAIEQGAPLMTIANREKDRLTLPVLERTLRLARRLR